MSNEKQVIGAHSSDGFNSRGLSQKLFFFLLVSVSVCNTVFFKISQKDGDYQYNTISAMVVVESLKLCISFCQCLYANDGDVKCSLYAIRETPTQVVRAYVCLALSYAGYNQLIFATLKDFDPGTFSLFKSLIPAVVGLINWVCFGRILSKSQMLCLAVQMLGIISVVMTRDLDGKRVATYGQRSNLFMLSVIVYGSVNTVYNAAVVKKESKSVPVYVQNTVLYGAGSISNFLLYLFTNTPERSNFFSGYNQIGVIMLLLLNSTTGVIISFVYKYGDAVLKTLAQPISSSLLVFISYVFFDLSLDIVKASGAGVVILSTLLYIDLPPQNSNEDSTTSSERCNGSRQRLCFGQNGEHFCCSKQIVGSIILLMYLLGKAFSFNGEFESDVKYYKQSSSRTAVCIRGEDRKVNNADVLLRTIVTPFNPDVFAVMKTVNGTAPELAAKLNVVAGDYEDYSFDAILAELEANGFNKTFWMSVHDQNALAPLGGRRGSGILQYQSLKRCYELISDHEINQRGGTKYDHIVVIRSDHFCTGEPFCLSQPSFKDSILIPKGQDFGGLNDRLMAIPRRAAKGILTGAWQKLLNNSNSFQFARNVETVVKANVEKSNLDVIRTNVTCFLACVPDAMMTSWSTCKKVSMADMVHLQDSHKIAGLENIQGMKFPNEFNEALSNINLSCGEKEMQSVDK